MSGPTCLFVVLLGLMAAEAIDGRAVPKRPRPPMPADLVLLATRTTVAAWLIVLWLGLSGRLLFAAVAAFITVAVFVFISREKQGYLAEPLVFSDIVFLSHIPRHPELFYLGTLQILVVASAILGLLGFIAGWVWIEPRTVGWAMQAAFLALALAVPVLAWLGAGAVARWLDKPLRIMRNEDPAVFVETVGLLASMVAGAIGSRVETRVDPRVESGTSAESGVEAVVVVQAESFTDLRRSGLGLALERLDAAKTRAFMHGRLQVPCFGAYTMRPEFGVITGAPYLEQGVGRFHPYLRPDRFASWSLPATLRRQGWHTIYVHPHDSHFFGRHRAIPKLGFDRFLDETAFAGEERYGPYVSDAAIARRLLAEVEAARAASRKLFIMVVTMEGHDPYGPGRLAETDDPVEQYALHAAHADGMLGALVDGLDRLTDRSLLLFYGDHAPLLPGFEALAADTDTDYVGLECGKATSFAARPAKSSRKRPDELNTALRNRLGLVDIIGPERTTAA